MIDPFRWAVTYNFAYRICSAFEHCPEIKSDREKYQITIVGRLALGSDEMQTKKCAQCIIIVDDGWVQSPPVVICTEPWIILGEPNWHISSEGVLCWDYASHWKDSISTVLKAETHGNAAEFGSRWFLRSTRNLLNRHLLASRSGIKEWRKEWDYWAHGEAAAREYLKSLA